MRLSWGSSDEKGVKLSVLFYSASTKEVGESLHTIIETIVPRREIETYQTTDGLFQRIRQSKHDHDIAILLAGSKQELVELVRIGDSFENLRVILIVPDGEEDAIENAHTLGPRLLAYADSEFLGVAAALSRMLVTAP